MEEQNIQNLLKDVQSKIDLYEKHKELSGENFNIFSIMGMESDEVFTHSAIISELLNPKGSHGLGSKPLELFITQFFLMKIFNLVAMMFHVSKRNLLAKLMRIKRKVAD